MDLHFFCKNKKLPMIMQSEVTECGLASIAMCFNYFGINVTLPQLRKKYLIGKNGMSLGDLSDICGHEGMIGDVYELGMEHMHELPLPAVLHWELSHFVVLKKVTKKYCIIHDPAIGEMNVKLSDVSKKFSGYAMSVEKGQATDFDDSKTSWDREALNGNAALLGFKELFTRSSGLTKGLVSIIILTLIAQLMTMSLPLINQVVIDNFIATGEKEFLLSIIMGGIGLMFFLFIVRLLRGWASIVIGFHWHSGFSSYFFQRLTRLPVGFFESRNIADVNTKFRVLDSLKTAFTDQLVSGFIDGLMSITTLIVMILYLPELAMISVGFLLVYIIIRLFLIKKEVIGATNLFSESVKESHTFFETISNILAVKLYGRESERYQQWKGFYLNKMNANIQLSKLNLWHTSLNELLGYVERLTMLYVGSVAVLNQEITLGMMFAFFAYREIFSTQSKSLLDNILSFKILRVDLDRLSDIEAEEVEQNMLGDGTVKNPVLGKISVLNMSFCFDGTQTPIFNDVSFDINQGEHVVLTGQSGSGKTTLMRLLTGVISPTSGVILIDDVPLESIGQKHYRKHIGTISQQEGLISGTLIDNISFFDESVNQTQIVEAAKLAHIYDEIMAMPMQFHTIVAGSHSCTLSGGQVQRILIARAFYAKPAILFMDEATSALDPKMEMKVVDTFKHIKITRVSIAHRKETIDTADRVIDISEFT